MILDEVQQAPHLLPYIQELIEERRELNGQYILSGSQNVLLLHQVSESLAGRAAILKLLPLSLREWCGEPRRPLPWQASAPRQPARGGPPPRPDDLWQLLFRGLYPGLSASPAPDWLRWQQSYIETYLERDVRTVRQVGDLMTFQSFLRLLAARSGQILNMTGIATELGLTLNTVKAWISVLLTSYQIIILQPYHANLGKRLVKRPKVYFTDTGTLCYLVGLRDPLHAMQGPMAGAIMETAVVAELTKAYLHSGDEPRLAFWRTARGSEVDLVVEDQLRLYPIEVKASATPRPEMARGIAELARTLAATKAEGLRAVAATGLRGVCRRSSGAARRGRHGAAAGVAVGRDVSSPWHVTSSRGRLEAGPLAILWSRVRQRRLRCARPDSADPPLPPPRTALPATRRHAPDSRPPLAKVLAPARGRAPLVRSR